MTLKNTLEKLPTRPKAKVDIVDMKKGNYTEKLIVNSPGGNLTTMFFNEKGKFEKAVVHDKGGELLGSFEQRKDGLYQVEPRENGKFFECAIGKHDGGLDFGWEDSRGHANRLLVHVGAQKGISFVFNDAVYVEYFGSSDDLDIYSPSNYEMNIFRGGSNIDFGKALDKKMVNSLTSAVRDHMSNPRNT